jgi:hypothetical protein
MLLFNTKCELTFAFALHLVVHLALQLQYHTCANKKLKWLDQLGNVHLQYGVHFKLQLLTSVAYFG